MLNHIFITADKSGTKRLLSSIRAFLTNISVGTLVSRHINGSFIVQPAR